MDEERAKDIQRLIDEVKALLGPEYFRKGQDVEWIEDVGPPSFRYDGKMFARKGGVLVAVREHGGRIETATVEQGGFGPWMTRPPLDPESN